MAKLPSNTPSIAKAAAASRSRSQRAKPVAAKTSLAGEKNQSKRERMRAQGMKLVQVWVPDLNSAVFRREARKQAECINRSPTAKQDQDWVDSVSEWLWV